MKTLLLILLLHSDTLPPKADTVANDTLKLALGTLLHPSLGKQDTVFALYNETLPFKGINTAGGRTIVIDEKEGLFFYYNVRVEFCQFSKIEIAGNKAEVVFSRGLREGTLKFRKKGEEWKYRKMKWTDQSEPAANKD